MKPDPREEISLEFGGKQFRVRPTFQIIAGIEAGLDISAKALGLRCLSASMSAAEREARGAGREISLTEMAVVLSIMLKGQPGAPENANEAGEILMEYGVRDLYAPIGLFLTRAQRGHKEHLRDIEESAERARKEAAADGAPDPQTESSMSSGG